MKGTSLLGTVFGLAFWSLGVASMVEAVPVVWGVHGGIGLSRVTHSLADEQSFRRRFNAGITATITPQTTAPFSFQTGLFYARKGGTSGFPLYSSDENGNTFLLLMQRYVWSLDYVEVPLMAQVSGQVEGIRCFAKVGSEAGMLLNARVSYPDWMAGGAIVERDIDGGLEDFDLSAVAGGGVLIAFGRNKALRFESMYVYGLTNIEDSEWVEMKTRTIRFNVGVDLVP